MKLRTDFVSNSSSSSFVLFGVMFEEEELKNLLKNSPFESVKSTYEEHEDSLYEILDELLDYKQFVLDECGNTVIGMSPRDMQDNETLSMFKKKVIDLLKTIGIEKQTADVALYSGVDSDGNILFDD